MIQFPVNYYNSFYLLSYILTTEDQPQKLFKNKIHPKHYLDITELSVEEALNVYAVGLSYEAMSVIDEHNSYYTGWWRWY